MPWTIPVAIFLTVAALRGSVGGTLADAAFYESIRRVFTPRATRSLTMADLPPGAIRTEPELPAKPVEPPSKSDELPPKPPEPSVSMSESEWRAKMTVARVALQRDEVLADGLQSRINALTADSIGRDDPAQRAELARQRARALAELDRLTLEIEKDKLAVAAIEDDARKKGIPPGWIR